MQSALSLLLIIAPDSLIDDTLRAYAAQKSDVMDCEVVSLQAVLASADGVDDPEKLKRYIYDRWRGDGAEYVLLVGDADVMPVRYMALDRVTEPAFDYAFYPSDLYYGDVARPDGSFDDWNAQKEDFHGGYFGEVRGEKNKSDLINFDEIDYRPEVAVGRWPVNTSGEVATLVSKSLAYEASVRERNSEVRPGAALLACGGWIENRPMMDSIAGHFGDGWDIEKRYFTEGAAQGPLPSEDEVVALINQGVQLVLHSGHGSDHNWHESIGTYSLDKLENADHPAILFSAGCSTARLATLPPYEAYVDVNGVEHAGTNNGEVFTAPPPPPAPYQRDQYNPTGFGEQLLRAGPKGAAAYIGCNTGSQPCGMTLMAGFVRALGSSVAQHPLQSQGGGEGVGEDSIEPLRTTPVPASPLEGGRSAIRLGDAWNSAVSYYYDAENLAIIAPNESWYPASIFFQGMKFMLFGDPSLPLPIPGEAGLPTPQDQGANLPTRDDISARLEEIRARHGVPALAAMSGVGGAVTRAGVAGVRVTGAESAATIDDLFHIGSCTKAMTATLAALMVNEGLIAWETTIAESLSDIGGSIDPGFGGVTIEQLLSHRSGLAEDRSPDRSLWPKILALEGEMRGQRIEFAKLVLAHPPGVAPGTEMIYSNAGYVVAGAMLERAGSDSWENLIRAKLFEPLGITTAGFGAPGESADQGAPDQPWGHRGETPVAPGRRADNPAVLGPAGTVHCSLEDWLKFERLHLGEEVGELQLDEATLAKLHGDPDGDGYALGWGVTEREWGGGTVLTHAGSNTMWFAVIWLAPERGAAYVAATNSAVESAPRACDEAIAMMIELSGK